MLPQSINLCSVCHAGIARATLRPQKYPRDRFSDSHVWYRERPIDNFLSAARSSCCICQLYFDSSNAEDLGKVLSNGVIETVKFDSQDTILIIGTWGASFFKINLLCVEEIQRPLPSPPELLLHPSTKSDNAWMFLTQCFLKCMTTHLECSSEVEPPTFLPTRLIDVGLHVFDKPRLILNESIQSPGQIPKYVTLSHSWGTGNPVRLLKSNMEKLQQQIDMHSLSQTFRDTILVTQKLGFRYLWIDSLCIIQDCHEDWERESALMQSVYSGGICNISATAASRGDGGLFTSRVPTLVSPFMLNLNTDYGPKPYFCFRGELWYRDIVRAPINRRGWVLQERILSPRTIYFSSQIFWECRNLRAAEMCPMGIPEFMETDELEQGSFHQKLPLHPSKAGTSITNNDWRELVVEYSCAKLTKSDDKLVALSGLAKTYRTVLVDEYLCGLWRKDLLRDLTWMIEDYGSRPDTYRAPSWSWASVDGTVYYRLWLSTQPQPAAEVLEVSVTACTSDTTGQIGGGSLLIRGWLRVMTLSVFEEAMGFDGEAIQLDVDDFPGKGEEELFILPLLSWEPSDEPSTKEAGQYLSLILRPLQGSAREFTRVGVLVQSTDSVYPSISRLMWDYQKLKWGFPNKHEDALEVLRTIRIV